MRQLAERAYFAACRTVGAALRSARYSETLVVNRHVRKRRAFHAPFLVWIARPLFGMLNTGVRVLSQHAWEDRERLVYRSLHGTAIRVDSDGSLVLPLLGGQTLAELLETAEAADRKRAIELTVVALAELHAQGFTHGDAMAENVMVDLEAGAAHWFDFENVHDASRPVAWCRADDLRALLTTCVLRSDPGDSAEMVGWILERYGDEDVRRLLAATFASVWGRSLAFHLGQAGLSFRSWRAIASHPDVA
jgi:hypothetical protein